MSPKSKSIKVDVSYRHTEPSEAITKYAVDKLTNCVQKFAHHDTKVNVVISVEKNRHIAEARFHCDGADFVGNKESTDMYASIDALCSSLSKQLRKHKENLKKHH